MKLLSLVGLLLYTSLCADVTSTNGSINFDVQNDTTPEMSLNSTGLGIGTTTGTSSLEVNGSLGLNAQLVSSNVTLSNNSLIIVDSSSANITLTLPSANSVANRTYLIKKLNNLGQVWIDATETIDGDDSQLELTASPNFSPYLQLFSNGSEWLVLNASADVNRVIAADNLIGWWKFDELSGTTVTDSSVNDHHASFAGSFSYAGNSITGKFGNALYYNYDTSKYLQVAASADYTYSNGYTYMIWAMPFSLNSNQGCFSHSGGGQYINMRPNTGGTVRWETDSGQSFNSTTTLTAFKWVHLAGSYNFNTGISTLYINGQLENSASKTSDLVFNTQTILIGKHGGDAYHGILDDFRIYNKALSAAEVLAIFKQGQ